MSVPGVVNVDLRIPVVDVNLRTSPIKGSFDLRTTSQEKYTELSTENSSLRETSRRQEAEITSLRDKVTRLLSKVSGYKMSLSFTNEKARVLGEKVTHLTAKKGELESVLTERDREIEFLSTSKHAIIGQLDQVLEELEQKEEALSTKETEVKRLKRMNSEFRLLNDPPQNDELESALTEKNKEIENLRTSKKAANAMLSRVTAELLETSGNLSTAQVEVRVLTENNEQFREANADFCESNNDLIRANETLGVEVRSLRASRTMEAQARVEQKENIRPNGSFTLAAINFR